jgi:hypothetical protein
MPLTHSEKEHALAIPRSYNPGSRNGNGKSRLDNTAAPDGEVYCELKLPAKSYRSGKLENTF